LDLCGHEKYLKTTMFGLVGLMPDYAMIVVGANMGVSRMTREHLGITLALGVPFYFVITKVDICPPAVYEETL
jgi:GTPase